MRVKPTSFIFLVLFFCMGFSQSDKAKHFYKVNINEPESNNFSEIKNLEFIP